MKIAEALINQKDKMMQLVHDMHLVEAGKPVHIKVMHDPRHLTKEYISLLIDLSQSQVTSLELLAYEEAVQKLLAENNSELNQIKVKVVEKEGLLFGTRRSDKMTSLIQKKIASAIPLEELDMNISLEIQWENREKSIVERKNEQLIADIGSNSITRGGFYSLTVAKTKSHGFKNDENELNGLLEEISNPINKEAVKYALQNLPKEAFEAFTQSFASKKRRLFPEGNAGRFKQTKVIK